MRSDSDILFLAVDGGATHCRARISDAAGRRLGEGRAGPASSRLGMEALFAEIAAAAAMALDDAGLPHARMADLRAGLGLAGLSLAADRAAVLAHAHPFASLAAESDALAACLGAHGGEDGGIVIFGTGSAACARVAGKTVTVGGWGFLLGDQGSAARLGLAAIRQALLAHDGQIEATDLSRTVMQRFDNEPEQAVHWAATAIPAEFGAIAPEVCRQAEAGDAMAVSLMREAGMEAARLIDALHARGVDRIALVGGFAPHLRPWLPEPERPWLVEPKGDALDGALVIARSGNHEHAARHAG